MRATLLAHEVSAIRIDGISPISNGTQFRAPEEGVVLVLADRTKRRWMSEDGGTLPSAGDILIVDEITRSSFVVKPEEFTALFTVAE